ncbi:MAG: exodeoxyribonuclease VII small subunit [Candidatus Marinimicrobia bacterium]|nr:exodeoxyribonuclease VII small subunit [Candidatus Neomarinimicrobiota bacterium]
MTKDKSFVFEDAMKELETIVSTLESESESLEKSMELFEKGIELSQSLRDHLDSAEQRIEILINESKDKIKIDKTDEE